jgi:hypothetical protein
METLAQIAQIIVGCGLLNVWLLRFNKSTAYRGSTAANMLEEFAAYGLPPWSCYLVGFLKVASAFALLAGLLPALTVVVLPAAITVALLMAGAVAMHVKVGDPLKKSVPALSVLLLSAIIIAGHWPAA